MPLDPDKLLSLKIPEVAQTYGERETILYALGVGLGLDPTNENDLAFVTEAKLKALPTMATVLGYPGFWIRNLDTGIDWVKVLHGEQGVTIHRPLPPRGAVVGRSRVVDIVDKGAGKGALVYVERAILDQRSGERLATLTQTTFCRGDGGFGGPTRETSPPHAIPERAPDLVVDLPTSPQSALIYRLSGDDNPLHADPAVAKAAGYPRPILHGLASFGVAGYAVLGAVCDHDPARLASISGRFSAPVFPGETIRTEMWRDGACVSFRARAVGRDVVAINNGHAEIRAS